MKKVLVLGSTGMAGHMISCYLREHEYQVYGISRSEQNTEESRKIDVSDTDALIQYIDEIQADVVINCVGLLQTKCQERPDLAVLINSYMPHRLEEVYKNTQVKIIHLSTDCVFSGDRGNYRVTDVPDGKTYYDRSKALGELDNSKDLTFRMSIIGPDIDPEGSGLFNWFMKQSGMIRGFEKAIWNGVTTLELAEAIDHALKDDLCGVYQLVPEEHISKYDLLLLFKRIFKREDLQIERDNQFVMDKTLVNERKDFAYEVRCYVQQIENLREWIMCHRNLYPSYYYR